MDETTSDTAVHGVVEASPTENSPDWTPAPDSSADAFSREVDSVLHLVAELARQLVGAHQSAAALIVGGDWKHMRKYFSLSSKYAKWDTYHTPATGFGIHADVVKENRPFRFTQAELEAQPNWKGFGVEAGKHPPMRGWLTVPLIGKDGRNYGMLQLSDKYNDVDFTEDDETQLSRLAQLTAKTLDALCELYHDRTLGKKN